MDNFLTFLVTKKGIMTVCASVSTVTFGSYQFNDYVQDRTALESLDIQFKQETPAIEYGDSNFDLNSLIEVKEGDVILPTLDVTKVGEQSLIFKVSKDTHEKEFIKTVIIQDTRAPEIVLTTESTSIPLESEFDIASLVKEVKDPIDGAISLGNEESTINYYRIEGSVDNTNVGDYPITVKAVDANGNEASVSSVVTVKEKEKTAAEKAEEKEKERLGSNYSAPDASVIAGGVVSIASSYNGASYSYGGASPQTGFDCSGFVQYVYGQAGVSLPRTAAAQGAAGTQVGIDDIQPGDVIVYNGGSHVAIYAGGGSIVHSLNPNQGVQTTGMSGFGTITSIARY